MVAVLEHDRERHAAEEARTVGGRRARLRPARAARRARGSARRRPCRPRRRARRRATARRARRRRVARWPCRARGSRAKRSRGESSRLDAMGASDLGLVGAHERAATDDVLAADDEAVDPVRAGQDEPGDGVVCAAELEPVGAPDGEVGLAPGSSEPMSSRPSTAAPPRVPSRSASRTVIASPPSRPRATSSACFTSRNRSLRSFEADPSTPSPTRTPASVRSRTGATPAPSRRFDVGQCATPVLVSREPARCHARRDGRSARTRRRRRASRGARGTRPACSRTAHDSTPPPRPSRRDACAAAARDGARAPPTPPSAGR